MRIKLVAPSKIESIKTKINHVSDTFRSFVEAKGSTVSPGKKYLSLTGTIERKNVPYYFVKNNDVNKPEYESQNFKMG